MNVQLLIDSIVRQTTVLIAQLATSGGVRAPLAHIANQVFLELSAELDTQGVSRKVSADMFGMALRAYLRKIQRLRESSTDGGRSLWEAVLAFLREDGVVSRRAVLARFHRDDEALVRSVLHDLTESGLVFRSGSGLGTTYRAATDEELGAMRLLSDNGADELLWLIVYREGPLSRGDLTRRSRLSDRALDDALARLVADGRVRKERRDDEDVFASSEFVIALGQSIGWEAAVLDHYQAMVKTICGRLELDAPPTVPDRLGGSTYTFDIWPGHPMEEEVYGSLRELRERAGALRGRVEDYNRQHGVPDEYAEVVFYGGQCVTPKSRSLDEESRK